jgi:hypothetical protein
LNLIKAGFNKINILIEKLNRKRESNVEMSQLVLQMHYHCIISSRVCSAVLEVSSRSVELCVIGVVCVEAIVFLVLKLLCQSGGRRLAGLG